MKYAFVVNSCMNTHTAQSGELNGFRQSCFSRTDTGTTVMIHDGSLDRRQLLGSSLTDHTVLLQVRQYQPEQILDALAVLETLLAADIVLFYGDMAGSELSVRFAARLGYSVLLDVTDFCVEDGSLLCRKRVYSGHLEARFCMKRGPWCLTVARGAAEPVPMAVPDNERVVIEKRALFDPPHWIQSARITPEERSGSLERADFVVTVGRGAGSRERCRTIAMIAESLGAVTGSSRLAAMEGWMPIHSMVGVSGTILRSAVSISVGISGSTAYTAGIQACDVVIAVNTDPDAPIVRQADVTVIEDAVEFMEALKSVIEMEQYNEEG